MDPSDKVVAILPCLGELSKDREPEEAVVADATDRRGKGVEAAFESLEVEGEELLLELEGSLLEDEELLLLLLEEEEEAEEEETEAIAMPETLMTGRVANLASVASSAASSSSSLPEPPRLASCAADLAASLAYKRSSIVMA